MPDLKKVIKALEYCVLSDDCRPCEYWMKFDDTGCQIMKDALELLKEQPEIVRCKDCIHFDGCDCKVNDIVNIMDTEWFCADGKRKEGW